MIINMGVSAQQYRTVTGCFATKIGSPGWKACSSGNGKRDNTGNRSSAHTSWGVCASALLCAVYIFGWKGLLLLATTVIVNTIFVVIVPASVIQIIMWIVSTEYPVQESLYKVGAVTGTWPDQSCQATWQIDIQLMRAGDVESNPGPGENRDRVTRSNLPGDDRLKEGKALLIHKAPANIRLVLSLWEPGKSDIKQCMDPRPRPRPPTQGGTWVALEFACD